MIFLKGQLAFVALDVRSPAVNLSQLFSGPTCLISVTITSVSPEKSMYVGWRLVSSAQKSRRLLSIGDILLIHFWSTLVVLVSIGYEDVVAVQFFYFV